MAFGTSEHVLRNYVDEVFKLVKDENLTPEKMYSADNIELLWQCLPRNMLAATVSSMKEAKKRTTMLVCKCSWHIRVICFW